MPVIRRLAVVCLVCASLVAVAAEADPAALIEKGHYKQAFPLIEKRLAANSKDADALVLMARYKLAYSDAEAAKKLLQQAIAIQPNSSAAHLFMADAISRRVDQAGMFEKMGLAKDIKRETEQAISLDPKNVDAYHGMMDYYLEAPGVMGGSVSKAREMAEKMMALDPVEGNLAKARIAVHEKQFDTVEGFYLEAVKAKPNSYNALLETSALYTRERWRNYDKSVEYGQKALQVDPARSAAYTVLAQVYALKESWSDLDQIISRAEKAVPDNLAPYFASARILINTGKDNQRAERYLRKYLTQEPEGGAAPLAAAHWRLGQILEKQGKKPEAIQEIQIAVQMKPDLKDAQKDLKRLKG